MSALKGSPPSRLTFTFPVGTSAPARRVPDTVTEVAPVVTMVVPVMAKAGIAARQAQAGRGHRLAGACGRDVERGRAAHVGNVIAADHAGERPAGDGGGCGAVVDLAGRGDAARDRQRRDVDGARAAGADVV